MQICTFVTWKQYFFLSNQNRVFFSKCIINATRLCQLWSHVKNVKLITRRDHLFFSCWLFALLSLTLYWPFCHLILSSDYVRTMSGISWIDNFSVTLEQITSPSSSHVFFFFSAYHHLFLAVRTDSDENITMGANLSISKSLMLRLCFKWDVSWNRDYFLFSNTISPFAWLSPCASSTSLNLHLIRLQFPGYLHNLLNKYIIIHWTL